MNLGMARILVIACLSFLAAGTGESLEGRKWIPVGPTAGWRMLPDRSNPNLWYSADYDNLYRSVDGAMSWAKNRMPRAYRFHVHPFDSTLYAQGPGLHPNSNEYFIRISRDGGNSFLLTGVTHLLDFYPDPLNSNTLYQSDHKDIYRSTNLGSSWQKIPVMFTPSQTFGCSAISPYVDEVLPSPFAPGSLYITVGLTDCPVQSGRSVHASFILGSHDGGATWKEEFISRSDEFHLVFDSATPDRAYAYSRGGPQDIAMLTADGWHAYPGPPCPDRAECSILNLAVMPRQSRQLLVLQRSSWKTLESQYKFCFTTSEGAGWAATDSPFYGDLDSMFLSDTQPLYQLVSSSGGIYRKDKEWKPANHGFESPLNFYRVLAWKQTVYAFQEITAGYVLFRSRDGGDSWRDLRFQLPKGQLQQLALDPKDPKHLIVEMGRGKFYADPASLRSGHFYASYDGGDSWTFLFRIKAGGSFGDLIVFDPVHAGTVFFSVAGNVYKSQQGGMHPKPLRFRWGESRQIYFNPRQIYVDPRKPDTVFFVSSRLFQSNDGGKTTYDSGQGLVGVDQGDEAGFMSALESDGYLLENDDAVILRSSSGGNDWRAISYLRAGRSGGNDPPGAGPFYSSDSRRTHFIGVCHGGLFESTDSGRTWKRINLELPIRKIDRLVMDLSDPSLGPLYVATESSGIWKAVNQTP